MLTSNSHPLPDIPEGKPQGEGQGEPEKEAQQEAQGEDQGEPEGETEENTYGEPQREPQVKPQDEAQGGTQVEADKDANGDLEGEVQGEPQKEAEIEYQGETHLEQQGEAQGEAKGDAQGKAKGEAQGETEGEAKGEVQGAAQGEAQEAAQGELQGEALLREPADFDEHVILRERNTMGCIHDIMFEFRPSRECVHGVANELLAAGLILEEDLVAEAENLEWIITQTPRSRMLTFRTMVGLALHDIPNERTLVGFAQLSLDAISSIYGAPALDPNHIDVFGRSPLD